ncbi:MAG TPA: hypothetical protein VHP83_08660 [Aggregatilineaceae bacterium]|nr:hypothetical protein [Aggregatilineaceae bacterium]
MPRSWYVAHNKETWWDAWQGFLDEYMKFDAGYGPFDDSWADVEAHYETATADDGAVYIVETNPLHLKADGAPTLLIYAGMGTATPERTQCSEMADSSLERLELHDGLCAGWSVRAEEYMGASILDGSEMPSQFYTVGLSIPLDDQTITRWIIAVPGERYASIESYIETLIQSVKVE